MTRTRYILRRRRKLKNELASNDNQAMKLAEAVNKAERPSCSENEREVALQPAA